MLPAALQNLPASESSRLSNEAIFAQSLHVKQQQGVKEPPAGAVMPLAGCKRCLARVSFERKQLCECETASARSPASNIKYRKKALEGISRQARGGQLEQVHTWFVGERSRTQRRK